MEKARIRRQSYEESKYLLFNTSRKMVDFKKKNKEEQNLLSQLEILELLVQDRESIIAAAQPKPVKPVSLWRIYSLPGEKQNQDTEFDKRTLTRLEEGRE